MPEKTLAVRLTANVAAYRQAMSQALTSTEYFIAGVDAAADKVTKDLKKIGDASDEHLREVGQNAAIAGGAIAAGLGLAVWAAADFDAEMSNLQAVSGATADQMDELRQSAIDAGQATVFSASEAAQAQVELAKAGVSTADILGGALTGALDLAAAGNLGLAQAAEIAANAMTTFGLSGQDVPMIADTLAAAANKSAADIDDMGMALSQAGLVSDQTGLSLQDTSGVLALFAQNGMKGSDAGTSLKTTLMRLTPTSKEAQKAMDGLGLSFYDAQGNFVGIGAAAEQLKTKLAPLTQEQRNLALQTIFGQDAIRGATILYSQGAAGVDEWVGKVTDSGYAAELAAIKTDNLKGDLEQLKGSIETVLIDSGSEANGVLRDLTQGMTDFVTGVGSAPGPIGAAGVGLAAIASGGLLAVGAIGTMLPKWREVNKALTGMGPAGSAAATGIGKAAGALTLAAPGLIVGATLWGNIEQAAREAVTQFTKDWEVPQSYAQHATQLQALIDQYNKVLAVAEEGNGSNLGGVLKNLGQVANPWADNEIKDAEAATHKYVDLIKVMQEENGRWAQSNIALQNSLGLTQNEVDRLASKAGIDMKGAVEDTVPAVWAFAASLQASPPAVAGMADSLSGLEDRTKSSKEKLDDLTDALKAFLDIAFGEEEATDAITKKMNSLQEALVDGKLQFEGNSDAALDFRDKMRGITDSAGDLIGEWARLGVQGDDLKGRVDYLTEGLINQAVKMGIPRQAAEDYFGKLREIPPEVYTDIYTPGVDDAQTNVGNLNELLDRTDEGAEAKVTADTTEAQRALYAMLEAIVAIDGMEAQVQFNARSSIYNDPDVPNGPNGRYNLDNNPRTPMAAGGSLEPWSTYRFHDTSSAEVARIGGESLLFTGAYGGRMTNLSRAAAAGQIGQASGQYMTAGGGQGPVVNIERLEVTTPANASADELADAVSSKVGWKLGNVRRR